MAFSLFDRHKKSLLECFMLLQRIKAAPHQNHVSVKDLQMLILKRIIACETAVRKLSAERHRLKASMRNKDKRLTKEEAIKVKNRIKRIDDNTEKYHKLIWIYREVGDGIAHCFIDAFTLKPLSFKESPGFISGKKGTRFERKVLRSYDPTLPVVFIMNDLTNCLLYTDFTIVGKDYPPNFLELKSGKKNKRTERDIRQNAEANKMAQYLATDKTDKLYGREGEFTRESMHADMLKNTRELNRLIKESREKGYAFSKPESGLIYLVMHDAKIEHLNEVMESVTDPHDFAFVNQYKYKNVGYYPFTLIIDHPEELFEFYNGNCQIIVMMNHGQLKRDVEAAGLEIHELTESEVETSGPYASRLVFSLKDEHGAVISYSDHFFGRVVAEFANYEWFKNELIFGAKSAVSRANSRTAPGSKSK